MNYAGPIQAEVEDPQERARRATRRAQLTSGTSSISLSRLLVACALPTTAAAVAAITLPNWAEDSGDSAGVAPVAIPVRPSPIRPAPSPAVLPEALVAAPARAVVRDILGPFDWQQTAAPARAVVRLPLAKAPRTSPPRGGTTAPAGAWAKTAPLAAPEMLAALSLPVAPAADAEDEPAREQARSAALAGPATVDPVPEAAAVPQAFGGVKGSFAALAPSGSVVGEALLAPEAAIIAAPSIPDPVREAAPGRRPPLTGEAAPMATPEPDPTSALAAVQEPQPAIAMPGARVIEAVPAPSMIQTPTAAGAAPVASAAAAVPGSVQITAAPAPASAELRAAASASVSAPARLVAPAPAPASAAARTPPAAASHPQAGVPDAPALASVRPENPAARPAEGALKARLDILAFDIRSQLLMRVDGKAVGKVDFRQTASGLAVRLGSIVELLQDRYDAAQLARIRASAAGDVYLSLAQLRAQGIPISYDPVYDEFNVGLLDTRPKAAHKVHMEQISTPERGLDSTGIDQIPRP